MRPCRAGMCTYVQLKDGSLDLADLALMNEYLDIEAENSARHHAANT